jgi:anti-anti-sigma regulatory factor
MEVEMVGEVAVVRFTQRSILSPDAIEEIGKQLFGMAESGSATRFVLNFEKVESLTTAMMGKLIALQRKVEGSEGRLALCSIGPFLSEIFKILRLPPQIRIFPDEQQALQSF